MGEKLIRKLVREALNDNFWTWFGNSKVVDENSNPLICYHGTSKGTFIEFKPKSGSKSKAKQQADIGSHFSIDKDYASGYAGEKKNSKTYEVYLKIENPLYINQMIYREDSEQEFIRFETFLQDFFGKKFESIYKSGDWHWNKNGTEKMSERQILMLNSFNIDKISPNKLYNTLLAHNYDGVFHEPYNMNSLTTFQKHPQAYIILSPNQVKSVDNKGTWSTTTNNIYSD